MKSKFGILDNDSASGQQNRSKSNSVESKTEISPRLSQFKRQASQAEKPEISQTPKAIQNRQLIEQLLFTNDDSSAIQGFQQKIEEAQRFIDRAYFEPLELIHR